MAMTGFFAGTCEQPDGQLLVQELGLAPAG
jgi:hypothetical protein